MTRRLVGSLSGVGAIHAGDVLLRKTHYDLSRWADDPPSAPEDPEAIASIEGYIDITGIAEAVVLTGADTLTLTIEDGRRVPFKLTQTGGRIVAASWLPAV